MREQKLGFVLCCALDLPIPAGAHNLMHVRRARGKKLVHITLAIRDAGDAVRPSQGLASPRRGVEPPLRFLVRNDARAPGIAFPLSRFQIWASTRPSKAWLPTSIAKAACNRSPPKAPPLPTGPYPLARARGPPSANSLVSWATTTSRPAARPAVSSTAWPTISSVVTEALRRKRVHCISRDRPPPNRRIQQPGLSTRAACKAAPLFPGGGHQTAPAQIQAPSMPLARIITRNKESAARALRNKDVCIR